MPTTGDSFETALDNLIAAHNRRVEELKFALYLSCTVHAGRGENETAEEWVAVFLHDARARLEAAAGGEE